MPATCRRSRRWASSPTARWRARGSSGHEGKVWFANFAAHLLVGAVAWVWLSRGNVAAESAVTPVTPPISTPALTGRQRATVLVVGAWIAGVLAFNLNLGLSAFAASAILLVAGAADETDGRPTRCRGASFSWSPA